MTGIEASGGQTKLAPTSGPSQGSGLSSAGRACPQEAHVPQALQAGMRVTLAVGAEPRTQAGDDGADVLEAEVRRMRTFLAVCCASTGGFMGNALCLSKAFSDI